MRLLLRLLIAAGGGLFVYASYEPVGWFWAGIVGIALFYICLCPWSWRPVAGSPTIAQGMLLGFTHGLVQYLLMLPWIGEFVGNLPYLALSVVLALYALATGAGGTAIARWRTWGPYLFPPFYLSVEYLRSHWPFGGFAWVRLAWGQIDGPLANLAAIGGPALVTLATVFAGVGLAMVLVSRRRVAGALTTGAVLLSGLVASLYVDRPGTSSESVEVAAIQGNVPRMGLDFNAQRRAVLANHVRETATLDHPVDLVIWPENSSDVNPFTDVEASVLINQALESAQAPILVGTITQDEIGPRNTMVVFDPESGAGDFHNKKFLQPFGEYMPFREFFRIFSSYVDQAGNFQPGDGTGVVGMNVARLGREVSVGIQTCYEVAFDAAGRSAIANGAEFLATPSNNATFGFTDMTHQQVAMSRMRAIEFDRAVVVAATSGVSAIIAPDGTVDQSTSIFEAATLTQEIPLKQTVTLAARSGFYVELLPVIIGAVSGIIALWAHTRVPAGASPTQKRKGSGASRRRA
ncbi:apolipoprotein N-acyltransferase [Corynebacterium pacaense]|uniref:apolipoprotein N-acyltransferase n=1 Tax=Corynebacterium pacaense TaxID=1816684 RepID=UPI0009BB9158|nr:apolipoprotein N-acyltransferase [Corynebacterium pacaense]